jgi:hypothetical protein
VRLRGAGASAVRATLLRRGRVIAQARVSRRGMFDLRSRARLRGGRYVVALRFRARGKTVVVRRRIALR